MNHSFSRTLLFVGVAAGSVLIAASAWYASQPSAVSGFADVGQPFFPDFDDVEKARALSVADYDDDEKAVLEFSVRQNDDGLWVIPSHHNYPAEAEDRLAKTATSLLGVKKTAVQSRSKDDWKLYGVVDPTADGASTGQERGTRLTLSDSSGNPLVNLIIGNTVEGRDKHYYVREPDKNTTYIAELDIDLSAKFSDWIEPDLLKITANDVVTVVLDNYSIDEQRGTIDKKEVLNFKKKDLTTSGDWQLADLNEETEELDKSPVQSIATNLDNLKIVGVREKPEGLDDNLRINPAVKQILQMQMQSLGYFIGPSKDGGEQLYANEGEVRAGTKDGVEYTLYFGEIARGTGKDIEVGLDKDSGEDAAAEKKDGDEPEESDTDADSENGPRRYLLVKAAFNEMLLGDKPVEPFEPVKPEILQEKEAAPKDGKSEEPATEKPAKEAEPAAEKKPEESADDSCGAADEEATDDAAEQAADDVKDEESKPEKQKSDNADKPADQKPADQKPADDKPAAEEKPADKPAVKEDEKPAASKEEPAAEGPAKEVTDKKEADKKEEPAKDPKQVAQEEYDKALSEFKAAKTKYDSDLKSYNDKVKAGQEKAEELSRRFAGWYYVISSDSFEKFRISRKDVVSKKSEEKDGEEKDEEKDGEETK